MNNVLWKRFNLSKTFKRITPPSTDTTAKELDIKDEPFENSIALITRGEKNNGIRGYIKKSDFPTLKKGITYNDQFSLFLFHNYEFTTIKDHLSIITPINNNFNIILNENDSISLFIVSILNCIFSKEIFSFSFTGAEYRFDREIILLPCLEVLNPDESICEENGKFYTLAVDYIKQLMIKAKELKEQKTIKYYEAERAKYEAERAKYEADYQKEKPLVIWKRFNLAKTFKRETPPSTGVPAKEMEIFDEPFENSVALITRAESNNGIKGYVKKDNYPTLQKGITYNDQFSFFLFHDYEFTTIKDHISIINAQNDNFQSFLEANKYINLFLTTILNHIFSKEIFSFNFTGAEYRYDREIILLPCLEVANSESSICEEKGKFYTLAQNFITYLYLTGKVNQNQKLIDEYTYPF